MFECIPTQIAPIAIGRLRLSRKGITRGEEADGLATTLQCFI